MEDIRKNTDTYVEWKFHKGVRYLHIRFCNTNDISALEIMMSVVDMVKHEPKKSIRVVSDIRHMDVTINTHKTIRVMSKMYQHLILKSTFIGLSKSATPFYKLYKSITGSRGVLSKNENEALEYIITD